MRIRKARRWIEDKGVLQKEKSLSRLTIKTWREKIGAERGPSYRVRNMEELLSEQKPKDSREKLKPQWQWTQGKEGPRTPGHSPAGSKLHGGAGHPRLAPHGFVKRSSSVCYAPIQSPRANMV